MQEKINYQEARDLLLGLVRPLDPVALPLEECGGRILARQLKAGENVPAFDRSPYDGYAFRAEDTAEASREHPVTLKILEEVPAGSLPSREVTRNKYNSIYH